MTDMQGYIIDQLDCIMCAINENRIDSALRMLSHLIDYIYKQG